MKMVLNNIGSIKSAEIEFNGITIIAGENNTGKSTISRSLFSFFSAFRRLSSQRTMFIRNKIIRELIKINFDILEDEKKDEIITTLINNRKKYFNGDKNMHDIYFDIDNILKPFNRIILSYDKTIYNEVKNGIRLVLEKDDKYYNILVTDKYFRDEFGGKIHNVCDSINESYIELLFKKDKVNNNYKYKNIVKISENKVADVTEQIPIIRGVFYYDSLNTDYNLSINSYGDSEHYNNMDYLNFPHNHKYLCDKKISFYNTDLNSLKELEKEFAEYFESFGNIGYVYVTETGVEYINKGFKNSISPLQIAQGLKSILVLKQIFINKLIKYKHVLILDEPEMNLHPKWQILLAEDICKLNADPKYELTILVCTHSPYFIDAIEYFSKKHKIDKYCEYYLAQNNDGFNEIINVTNDIDKIYKSLYEPTSRINDDKNDF